MTNKPKHGGARAGAGRPKKEPTTTLAYRVPQKHAAEIDTKVRAVIKEFTKPKTNPTN